MLTAWLVVIAVIIGVVLFVSETNPRWPLYFGLGVLLVWLFVSSPALLWLADLLFAGIVFFVAAHAIFDVWDTRLSPRARQRINGQKAREEEAKRTPVPE
jgi:hypothetical protein